MAEPILPTTTPAAKFANLQLLFMSICALIAKAIDAITVSPAPVTSYTSFATVGNCFISSSKTAIPPSLKVIIDIARLQSDLSLKRACFNVCLLSIIMPVAMEASFLFGVRRYAPLYFK